MRDLVKDERQKRKAFEYENKGWFADDKQKKSNKQRYESNAIKYRNLSSLKNELKEEIHRGDVSLWWSRARNLRKTEKTNERLDLVLEILLSEQMERRLVY